MFETTAYSHLTLGNLPDPQKCCKKDTFDRGGPRWPHGTAWEKSAGQQGFGEALIWWRRLNYVVFLFAILFEKDEWWVKLQGIYNRKFGTLHFLPMALITWGILRNDVFASFWALQAVMSKLCSALPFAPLFQRLPCSTSTKGFLVCEVSMVHVTPCVMDLTFGWFFHACGKIHLTFISRKSHWILKSTN